MSQPLLSILIPLTPDRRESFGLLRHEAITQIFSLNAQYKVQFTFLEDNKEMTIGEKREIMYRDSLGLYSWQIDSDDMIAPNAIELILEAIKQQPDCITFEEHCLMDGKEYKSNHSLEYADWEGDGQKLLVDSFHFHRTPFMKSVIKTSIAQSVPIPHVRFGEDHQWSQALKQHLLTEVHIPKQLYLYRHQSTDFNTRYGFDKH